jgi:plasmid maintenance system antidote protein VapI
MARYTYLTPEQYDADDALVSAFRAHTAGQTKFTRRMAIILADMFGETPRQIVLRLERRGLLKRGSWDWFAMNGGITREQIAKVRADIGRQET